LYEREFRDAAEIIFRWTGAWENFLALWPAL
jgi:hypothetical protein